MALGTGPRTGYYGNMQRVSVKNGAATAVPAYGLMKVTGFETATGAVTVTRPDADSIDSGNLLINGPTPIAVSAYGVGSRQWPLPVAYDTGSGTPAVGDVWGAASGSYLLTAGKSGFYVQSDPAQDRVLVTPSPPSSPFLAQGRLSHSSTVPEGPVGTQTDFTTIYFVPYLGNQVSLPDSTATIFTTVTFTATSLSLSGITSGKNYDVFGYNNSGSLALELSSAWTDDSTRADAVGLIASAGIYCKTSDKTRLYLGTIRASASNTSTDGPQKRYLWNFFNRKRRTLISTMPATSWSQVANVTWEYVPTGASGIQGLVQWVVGVVEEHVHARYSALFTALNYTLYGARGVSIGSDQGGLPDANCVAQVTSQQLPVYTGVPPASSYDLCFAASIEYLPRVGYGWLEAAQVALHPAGSGASGDTWNPGTNPNTAGLHGALWG